MGTESLPSLSFCKSNALLIKNVSYRISEADFLRSLKKAGKVVHFHCCADVHNSPFQRVIVVYHKHWQAKNSAMFINNRRINVMDMYAFFVSGWLDNVSRWEEVLQHRSLRYIHEKFLIIWDMERVLTVEQQQKLIKEILPKFGEFVGPVSWEPAGTVAFRFRLFSSALTAELFLNLFEKDVSVQVNTNIYKHSEVLHTRAEDVLARRF